MAVKWRMWMCLLSMFAEFCSSWGLEYCEGNYWCDKGHCCGKGKCCTYNYYELWWFWVIWLTIALLGCCCFYQRKRLHRRRRRRTSDRSRHSRSHTDVTLHLPHVRVNAQQAAQLQFYPPVFEPGKVLHLPTYEEISDLPQDPPSYNLLYSTSLPQTDLCTPHPSASIIGDVEPAVPGDGTSVSTPGAVVSHSQGTYRPNLQSDSVPNQLAGATHIRSCVSEVDESISANLLDNAVGPAEDTSVPSSSAVIPGGPPPYTPYANYDREESTTG